MPFSTSQNGIICILHDVYRTNVLYRRRSPLCQTFRPKPRLGFKTPPDNTDNLQLKKGHPRRSLYGKQRWLRATGDIGRQADRILAGRFHFSTSRHLATRYLRTALSVLHITKLVGAIMASAVSAAVRYSHS